MKNNLSHLTPFQRLIVSLVVKFFELLAPFFPSNDDTAGTGGAQ